MTWKPARMKYVARFGYGEALPTGELQEGPFEVFGSNGPYSSFARANTGAPAIIIGRKGSFGKVNWTNERCFASDTTFIVDAATCAEELRWVYWLLQTLRLDELNEEAAIPGLNREAAHDKAVLVPPRSEQRRIAHYLDRETARLDALVAAKERLLGLLAEKRQALITRTITRGLDRSAPFRDSGIPWLGPIPAHWKTERAKWLFRERDERSPTGEEELLTVSHLTGVTPRSEKDVNMFEAETTEGYKLCHQGDLVINTLWAWMGAMGIVPVTGIVSPAYNVYMPTTELDPDYIDTLVRLSVFAQEVTRYSKGVWSSRLRLYPEGFFETVWPVPPLAEQNEIVTLIRADTEKIQTLSAAAERTISLLKERRSALIADAVTGKLQVS